jgi:hypothetical protein
MVPALVGQLAHAAVPVVIPATGTSAVNSISPKIAVAECPFGTSVLGGAAYVSGAEGQVLIQAAFPVFDSGLKKFVYVVKAIEANETADNWSVTAGAYCTSSGVATLVQEPSAFDSEPIKSVTVECPAPLEVVGLGGEVSTIEGDPLPDLGTTAPSSLVFHGMEADVDLRTVTAHAIEVDANSGGDHLGPWKITAIAACALPFDFDGLELRRSRVTGGLKVDDTESRLTIGCSSKGKRVIAAASTIDDHGGGYWYLDRFSRTGGLEMSIYAEAHRTAAVGHIWVRQSAYVVCVDK